MEGGQEAVKLSRLSALTALLVLLLLIVTVSHVSGIGRGSCRHRSDTAAVDGHVYTYANNQFQPAVGASVTASPGEKSVTTSQDGFYCIILQEGQYTLTATLSGYDSVSWPVLLTPGQTLDSQEFYLPPASPLLISTGDDQTIFHDDFAQGLFNWSPPSGIPNNITLATTTWSATSDPNAPTRYVAENTMLPNGWSPRVGLVAGDPSWTDYTFSVWLMAPQIIVNGNDLNSNSYTAAIVRYVDYQNFVGIYLKPLDSWELGFRVNNMEHYYWWAGYWGGPTLPLPLTGQWYHLSIKVQGNRLTFRVSGLHETGGGVNRMLNDAVIFDNIPIPMPSHGQVGLGSLFVRQAEFADALVVSSPAAPLPVPEFTSSMPILTVVFLAAVVVFIRQRSSRRQKMVEGSRFHH